MAMKPLLFSHDKQLIFVLFGIAIFKYGTVTQQLEHSDC